ncbi:MAG: hypothetical protein ABIH23_24350 [bacterium]
MKRNEIRITSHFHLLEFEDKATGLVRIHPLLPLRLEQLRSVVNEPLVITSSCRIWSEHERIYRRLYGERWAQEISLTSKHLLCGPGPEELIKEPILAERLREANLCRKEPYQTCSAADIRRLPQIPLDNLANAARPLFDFVKPYPWGIHVDLRYTPLDG